MRDTATYFTWTTSLNSAKLQGSMFYYCLHFIFEESEECNLSKVLQSVESEESWNLVGLSLEPMPLAVAQDIPIPTLWLQNISLMDISVGLQL